MEITTAIELQSIVLIVSVVLMIVFLILVPVVPLISALISGVNITLTEVILMRLRKIPVAEMLKSLIEAHKAHLKIRREELEALALAGGDVRKVVHAMILAKKSGIELTFKKASNADLTGINLMDLIRKETVIQNEIKK